MHAFVLTWALFSPGDPLALQAARLAGLESAISSTALDYNDSYKVVYRQRAVYHAILARQQVNRWLAMPPAAYQPFGYFDPIVGTMFMGPAPVDSVDGLISQSEDDFGKSL